MARRREQDPGALTRRYQLNIAFLAAIGVVAALAPVLDPGVTYADLGLTSPTTPEFPWMVGYAMAIAVAVTVRLRVDRRRARRGARVRGERLRRRLAALHPATARERWYAAGLAVTAGVAEEVAFRGLLIAVAVGLFHLSVVWAATTALVVFAWAHLYQGVLGALNAAMLGGVLTYLYLLSGTIWVAIAVHVLWDLAVLLLVPRLLAVPPDSPASAAVATTDPVAVTPAVPSVG